MRLATLLEQKSDGGIKVTNTQIQDSFRGESFGHKYVTVDGIIKAAANISILDDGEVSIMDIDTADDSRRKGYATMLVDDLFREYAAPGYFITTSMQTPDGVAFFKQYDSQEGVLRPRSAIKSPSILSR